MGKYIYVLNHGWVVVGEPASVPEDTVVLNSAHVVRRWGTTKGLGELADKGPQAKTVLDPLPDGTAVSGVIMQIPCNAGAWK